MKHVVFAISTLYGGGAERVVSVWASALAERGYDVSVVTYARVENEYSISPKVQVCPIASSVTECNGLSMLARLKRFRRTVKALKPDVIISFLPEVQVYVALATVGLRIPRIETIRISPWEVSILKTKFAPLWRWCFKSCRALILQSKDQGEFFPSRVQNKSVVIPNPINQIYIDNKKTEYSSASHKIVAAGRLSEQKNYKMLIDAVGLVLAEYPDVTLEIYGEGPLEKELTAYIKDKALEGNIRLMGRTSELYRVYRKSDLYVMSSNYEGMPNALAEAMAIGLPSISTDCRTGPRDLIDDGKNGYLVECGDSAMLAEKIKAIFSMSTEEQRLLGTSAREKVVSFCSEENSLAKLIALIKSI